LSSALDLLERLGAIHERRMTPLGRALSRVPAHPRLARLLLGCGATPRAAAACAVLDSGLRLPDVDETTTCDLLPLVDRLDRAPRRVRDVARQLERVGARFERDAEFASWLSPGDGERQLCHALLTAYPDRVAQRRERGSPRLKLAVGPGALLTRESGVREGEFLVAVEMRASKRGAGAEARVTSAAHIDREWLEPTATEIVHELDPDGWRVRATKREMYESLILAERAAEIDPEAAALLRRDALVRRGLDVRTEATLRRLRFAGIEVDVPTILLEACRGASRAAVDPLAALDWRQRQRLRRCAPEKLVVPSGRAVALDYRDDGSVLAAVKLQELFGLGDSPRLGPGDVPVTFSLLAPNGRPVQTTRDLRSFWNGAYADVRKELRGRYPKHPWPADPWSAEPAKPR
jgi:ATP-dependent helicase HrpB